MIKVCHIVNLITGKSDGVYAHLKMIFRNSDKTKFQHYLIFQGGESIEKEVGELGVKVFVSSSLKKKISVKAFADIYKILKRNNVDIIHTHLIKPYAIAGLINIFTKKKFIFNYHGIFLKNNPYYNFIERSIYSVVHYLINLLGRIDVVLVPSKMSKRLLMEETTLFPEPIVYYNGYNQLNSIKTNSSIVERVMQIKSQGKIIAIVARLEIQKRLDKALRVFNSLIRREKNTYLLIFGNGDLKNDLTDLTREFGIESQVIFFDYVPNISVYYKFFNIVLFTSDWEGMPLTLWEAMANEVPVVAPDVGGFKEILEENNCGLIYEPGNLNEAENKLLKLLEDEQFRKTLGENGRAAIETKYNEKKFTDQIQKIYFDLSAR